MDILQNTLSAGKSDIKTKHDSLSSLTVTWNQTYDKMRRMSKKGGSHLLMHFEKAFSQEI